MQEESHTHKILDLLKSTDSANVDLAFQLCIGLKGNYSPEVAKALIKHPIHYLKYQLEDRFAEFATSVTAIQDDLSIHFKITNENIHFLPLERYLNFSEEDLQIVFQNCPNLTQVDLSGCRLKTLPPAIWQLSQLTSLNLDDNRLTQISSEVKHLTKLETLNLWGNELNALPPEIGALKHLTQLTVSANNFLTVLPPEVMQLQYLQELSLYGNQFNVLPHNLNRLHHLEILELHDNKLTRLPESLYQCTKLKSLDIRENPITELPPGIEQLTQLHTLQLGRDLIVLPKDIRQLSKLTHLDLWIHQPDFLLAEGIKNLQNIEEMWLRGYIEALPPNFSQFKKLQKLYLKNATAIVPKIITKLPNLILLYLEDLRLTSLPPELGQMKSLKNLYIHGNNIPPDEIDQLRLQLPDCEIDDTPYLPF